MTFEKLNPISLINDNIILTNQGDISLAFKITLPEVNTISVSKYNELHSALSKMLLVLPENTLLHRQDVFLRKNIEISSLFNKEDFFEASLHKHFEGREYVGQDSYLYITALDSLGFKKKISNIKLLKKITNKDKFTKKIEHFNNSCLKAISILKDEIEIKPLKERDLIGLVEQHFNGHEPNKVSSAIFNPKFKIGKKHFAIYGLDEDINQKDGDIDLCTIDPKMSSEISKMYSGYMSNLGYALPYEHTLNTYIFYDDQVGVKKNLEDQQKKLTGVRLMGRANQINAERIDDFLNAVENENLKIVRTHFNITLFDNNEKRLEEKERELQASFSKLGIVPTEYSYLDYPYLFLANTPGCGGGLPSDYTFYSYLDLALIYTLFEGNHVSNSDKGYYYCNRNNNIPFKLDTFFEPYESKLIDNRNYFVIAPSGGGKSFSSRNRLFQQYKMGFDQVVINLGGDDKMVNLINSYGKEEAMYVLYEEGKALPVNPFYVDKLVSNSKIEFLIDFIWLLWGGDDEIPTDTFSILNKIIATFYGINNSHIDKETGHFIVTDIPDELSIKSFYDFLIEEKELIETYFNNDKELFNINSLLINLEKYATGNYSTLFQKGKPEIYEKKKYIEFELDNIKDHPFLFPLFSMLISDITFNTMWAEEGCKDFFIDEGWKILEKKGMALLLKYLYKTIRKFDGAVGIAVQQITDIFIDEIIANAIIGNCAIKYILNHKNVLSQIPILKERLSLTEKDISMLLSIKNKTKPEFKGDNILYTEQLIIMGSDYSKVVRNEVSPELAVIYDSEKSRLKRFNTLFKENNNNIETTITQYLNLN